MRKFLHSLVFLIIGTQAIAQGWQPLSSEEMGKILQGINDRYKNMNSFSVKVTHCSYENYFSSIPADKSTGYFKKEGMNFHSFLLGIHSVQNGKYKVVVDTSQNSILVTNPSKDIAGNLSMDEYEALLKQCSSLKTYTFGTEKHYRMEFKNHSFSATELVLNPEGLMKELVFYYAREVNKNPSDPNSSRTRPRLTITFSDYIIGGTYNYNEEFDESGYFTSSAGKLTVTDAFKKFRLRDLRVPVN